jgi:Uma2 family endonuclease
MPFLTPSEYLQIERRAELKSEYYNGEMFEMPPKSLRHVAIVVNLTSELSGQLHDKAGPCSTA